VEKLTNQQPTTNQPTVTVFHFGDQRNHHSVSLFMAVYSARAEVRWNDEGGF